MKVRATSFFMLVSVVMLVLAACDGQTPQPTPAPPTPTGVGPAPVGGDIITYATTGSFVGVNRELVITSDGSATLTEREGTVGPVSLPATRMSDIQAKLDATNFMDLEERYGAGNVADDILHTITLQGDSGIKSVTMEGVGGQEVTPQAVQELFTLMAEVEEEVRVIAVTTPTPNPSSYQGRITIRSEQEATGEIWLMTISESGDATVTDGERTLGDLKVAPEKLEEVRAHLAEADFFALKIYYGSRRFVPNDRVYTINLQADGKTKGSSRNKVGGRG